MNLLDKFSNRSQLIVVALVVFSVFVGLGCISAADSGAIGHQVGADDAVCSVNCNMSNPFWNKYFPMSVRYNAGTGYHWEVSPKTHGVTLMTKKEIPDNPGVFGSSGTLCYNFLIQKKDYYIQLDLISPSGEVVNSTNSNIFIMPVRYNAGTGYHWEVSPKTHGVTFMTKNFEEDHPGAVGSPGTLCYNFLVQDKNHFYVQLNLVSPSGKIVKSVNSKMLNSQLGRDYNPLGRPGLA